MIVDKVIVVGGGLAGVSACHTVLEHGGKVLLLDKSAFCGGNSTKATSGFNAAYTKTQILNNAPDSVENFKKDIFKSANLGKSETPYELGALLAEESDSSFEWLTQVFKIDLSLVSRLGGHSGERTHRGKEKFPGMTITYGLLNALEKVEEESKGEKAKIICKARVFELIKENNKVVGVKYIVNEKDVFEEYGVVILATGGFAADFEKDSLLMKYRPDLEKFSTTNGAHCTGDGLKMTVKAGGDLVDMEWIQVHPTGLVHPRDPNNKVKWLAAEALRGVGGILLNKNGERFCDELGRRDYVSGEMIKNQGPFRLVLSSGASKEIQWHCNHYIGRGVMKKFNNLKEIAQEMGITYDKLSSTIDEYNQCASKNFDKYGRKYFNNTPINKDELFHVSIVTPVVHYVMGGIKISAKCEALAGQTPIQGLYAAGEVAGGVHGKNRLGGNSLAECVVFGRIAGKYASQYLLQSSLSKLKGNKTSNTRFSILRDQMKTNKLSLKEYTLEEISKHNTDKDCWVIIRDQVYDVSGFLQDHPGGVDSIMAYAGGDATESFEMMHDDNILKKYGPNFLVGKVNKNKTSFSQNKTSSQCGIEKPTGPNVPDYLVLQPSTVESRVSGGTHGILDNQREKVSFPIIELTDEINGGKAATKRRKFVESMVNKDEHDIIDRYNYTRQEHVSEHTKDFIRIHKPYKSFKPTRMDIAYMSMASTATGALSNSHSIFLQTIYGQGSQEQVDFWGPKSLSFEICGSYAQTELGHGSNVRGLQTTAEYDKNTEEFILNTPTLQSIKWWPGCLGKVATHVVLYAQLLIDGKEYGLNVFMLQIRDENHLPLPGIRLGDLGTKVGDHGNDTGFMILENVRIPREYMLNKFKNVTKEGVYETNKDVDPRVNYMTMIATRAMMVITAGARLAQAATIATRYSLVRKQGFVDTKKGVSYKTDEHSIFDHKMQRYKLMKQIAAAYVVFFSGRWIVDFLSSTEGKNFGIIKDTSLLKEIMATSAGLKSLTSYMATVGIEELRKACGGNGYLLNSGIAAISCDYLWQVTAEGDFTILALLTGSHILNSLGKTFGGHKLQGIMDYFNVVSEEGFHLSKVKPSSVKRSHEFSNLAYLLDLFKYRSLEKNIETAIEFNKRITKKGERFEVAFGNLAQEIIKGVHAHCQFVMFNTFVEKVKTCQNKSIKDVLTRVAVTYALTNFLDDNWGEVINGDQYRLIRNCLNETLDQLRPDAIGLVDAFDFPDTVLKSTIGKYDGNIYEALFDSAQRSTLNQQDPYDGFKYLQPHTNKELLKRGNKPVQGIKF